MADWLKDKPAKNEDMGLAPDQIKGNWEYLEDALKREHDFPGTYGASGRHKKVTLIDVGETPPSNPNGHDRVIYAQEGWLYVIDAEGKKLFALSPDELAAFKIVAGINKTAGTENLAGVLKLWSAGDNEYYVQISATEQSESYTLKLPAVQGEANKVLVNDGSGNLSWKPWYQNRLLHVEDQRSPGVSGGQFEAGDWRTRVLNTVVTNEISGASLSSNRVTLPAGTYEVEWSAPGFAVNTHKTRLYDATGEAMLLEGTSEDTVATEPIQTRSVGFGRITLSEESEIELQHQCLTTKEAGFGRYVGDQLTVDHETYSILKIRQVP
jgi:hypothetical protein